MARATCDESHGCNSITVPLRSDQSCEDATDCEVPVPSLLSASTDLNSLGGSSSDTLGIFSSGASSSHVTVGIPQDPTSNENAEMQVVSKRSKHRKQAKCSACGQHQCVSGRECRRQNCIYCHGASPGTCDKQCQVCYRPRCKQKWWRSGGNAHLGVCGCSSREDRERSCHSICSESCKARLPEERKRIFQELQCDNSEEMSNLLNFNLMVSTWYQLPQQALDENRAADVAATFKKLHKKITEPERRTLGPGGSRGLFLADALNVRLANAMGSTAYRTETDRTLAEAVKQDFDDNIWPRIVPYLNLHRDRVLIIFLESETREHCRHHFDILCGALRSTAEDPRVVQKMYHEVSEIDSSWASVMWILGHSEAGRELKYLRRRIQSVIPTNGIDFAFLGVCKSASDGMLLADAGIPVMCVHGLAEPREVYTFAQRVLTSLLRGPVEDEGSSSALVAQLTSAFTQAGGSKRSVYKTAFRCKCCFCHRSRASSRMRLFLPSQSGRILDKIRRWPRTCIFLTFTLLAVTILVFFLRLCPDWQCLRDNWYGAYQPCNGIEIVAFPEAGGEVRILAVDMSCHDLKPAGKRRRIDIYSGQVSRASYLVLSHTAYVNAQDAVAMWVKQGVGPHFIITRDGSLITLVHADGKAFFIKGCFGRYDTEPNCSRLEANAHGIGVMLEGNGCVKTFSEDQYATLFWLVGDLRRQGYNISDDRIMPLTEPDFFHGRMVAPCHHFDWRKMKSIFAGVTIPRSWNGSNDVMQKRNWSMAVDVDYVNKIKVYGEVMDYRKKWIGYYGEAPMSDCIALGKAC